MKALVVNYGVGNLFSISSALRRLGIEVYVDNRLDGNYDLIVFPGVGNFSSVAKFIKLNADTLNGLRNAGIPFLGICIGMHIMLDYGLEGGLNEGLHWLMGYAGKINAEVKLPHIGWDKVYSICVDDLNEGIDGQYVYFMHSYIAYTSERCCTFGHYGIEFPALLHKDNLIGTQFHPEKSGKVGVRFLSNVVRWLKR